MVEAFTNFRGQKFENFRSELGGSGGSGDSGSSGLGRILGRRLLS